MKEFQDRVAVITGAASGIGFAIAEQCAREGMKVVLAGINLDNLERAEVNLAATGATTLCVQADVSRLEDVERLAHQTLETFGAVHLLVNNAGVGAGGPVWATTLADWQWVIDVNLWGVIYGLHVFVPIMLDQGDAAHIVNTASVAGLLPYYPSAPYQVSKRAVVALSENLHHSLAQAGAMVRVSVLCPGWVKTAIIDSERNRPPQLQGEVPKAPPGPAVLEMMRTFPRAVAEGMAPQEVAAAAFLALREERFWIFTSTEWHDTIRDRVDRMLG